MKDREQIFNPVPPKVILIYKYWQDQYEYLKKEKLVNTFIQGLPEYSKLIDMLNSYKDTGGTICILDDSHSEMENTDLELLYTEASHHCK